MPEPKKKITMSQALEILIDNHDKMQTVIEKLINTVQAQGARITKLEMRQGKPESRILRLHN